MNAKKIISVFLSLLLLFGVFAFALNEDFMMGDANGDKKVNSADARVVLRISARLFKDYTQDCYTACDVNGDSKVTSADARLILCVSAKIYDSSYFVNPFTTGEVIPMVTTSPDETNRTDVDWDQIIGTSAPAENRTEETSTTHRHPNNYHTTDVSFTGQSPDSTNPPSGSQPGGTEIPGTVPSETNTPNTPDLPPNSTQNPGNSDVTAPTAKPTAKPPIVHTNVPPRPTGPTDPPPPTNPPTTPPTTASADLPAFSAKAAQSGNTVRITLSVKNAAGLKSGTIHCSYLPDDFKYVKFEPGSGFERIDDFRETGMGECDSEFILKQVAEKKEFVYGTLVFERVNRESSSPIEFSIEKDARWRNEKGKPLSPRPETLKFFVK